MSLVYVCSRCGAQAATRYVRPADERSVSVCCGEPITLDTVSAEGMILDGARLSHTFPHRADGTVEEHITRGGA